MRRILIALAALTASAGAANAQQILAAGGLYGGPAQKVAVCYFYNAGPSFVSLASTRLLSQFGAILGLSVNQCGVSLAPGQTCGIAANILNNQSYSCTTTVSPNKTNMRGVLEVRDSTQLPLKNVPLQ